MVGTFYADDSDTEDEDSENDATDQDDSVIDCSSEDADDESDKGDDSERLSLIIRPKAPEHQLCSGARGRTI